MQRIIKYVPVKLLKSVFCFQYLSIYAAINGIPFNLFGSVCFVHLLLKITEFVKKKYSSKMSILVKRNFLVTEFIFSSCSKQIDYDTVFYFYLLIYFTYLKDVYAKNSSWNYYFFPMLWVLYYYLNAHFCPICLFHQIIKKMCLHKNKLRKKSEAFWKDIQKKEKHSTILI